MATSPHPPSELLSLFSDWAGDAPTGTAVIPPAGSDRRYWRFTSGTKSAIGTWNPNQEENAAFISYARHFHMLGMPVPEVYTFDETANIYLQQDLGSESLLQYLLRMRATATEDGPNIPITALRLYKESLSALARLQVEGGQNLDYSVSFPRRSFDARRMLWDLNYFKYSFLKLSGVKFDEDALQNDMENLVSYLLDDDCDHFMFRDFQARNIMVFDGRPYFIDFQGGCRGALQYDVASLLFQAKAKLPHDVRSLLFKHYVSELRKYKDIDEPSFTQRYSGYVLLRQLQTMGAYGFRGLHERRGHFLESIPPAIENVRWVLDNMEICVDTPELRRVLYSLHDSPVLTPLLRRTDVHSKAKRLIVEVVSFAYKNGIPEDRSGHFGGFVFDCRGLNNPGRLAPYKPLTGNDKPVQDFLLSHSKVSEFLQHAHGAIRISVESFLERGFERLMVSFGCTGGQHRSVFCARETAEWLRRVYGVPVVLRHREQGKPLRKAMILAAGLGTRLRPLTDQRPKALLEVNGVTLLELQLRRLRKAGFDEVVVNVHHHAEMVVSFLREHDFGIDVHISDERDELLDTGGALLKARAHFKQPFFVCNVDVLTDFDPQELGSAHIQSGALGTLAVRDRKTARYFCFDEDMTLDGWRNVDTGDVKGNPTDSIFAFSGMAVIDPQLLDLTQKQGAFSVVDMYIELARTKFIKGMRHDQSSWLDVGRPEHLPKAGDIVASILKSLE